MNSRLEEKMKFRKIQIRRVALVAFSANRNNHNVVLFLRVTTKKCLRIKLKVEDTKDIDTPQFRHLHSKIKMIKNDALPMCLAYS